MKRSQRANLYGRGLAMIAGGLTACGAGAQPVSIPIVNAGFEADFVSPGCFQVFQPTGWTAYDPGGILDGTLDALGALNQPVGSVFFPGGAPEGDHVALVFLSGDIGQGPAGITQVLSATLAAHTRYVLTVEVGDIASGTGPPPCDVFGFFDLDGFPGYQVQLLAGGVVIAQDDNSLAGVLADGTFALSTVEVIVDDAHPQMGQPLEIRLINLNIAQTPEHPGIEVDFDDVRLTAEFLCGCPGDLDGDCDVDGDDLAQAVLCMGGPGAPPAAGCLSDVAADVDGDGDVDMLDIAAIQAALPGACY